MQTQSLKPNGYRSRHIDARLDTLLQTFGAVEVAGSKWCGKTWTALAHSASVDRLDKKESYERAMLAPETALLGDRPHLVDEWQEVPAVWDAIRRAVDDASNEPGQFILTGSTRPKIKDGREGDDPSRREVHHSGAGRIKRLRMWPMTLAEQGESVEQVSLRALFDGDFAPIRRETTLQDVARWCCRGGWPASLGKPDEAAFEMPVAYVESLLDVSIPRMGLSPSTASSLVNALALNLAQAATLETLAKDMARGDKDAMPARTTVDRYLEALRRLFLIDEVPGWEPPLRSKARIRIKPKRYFADPSLAAAILHATPRRLMEDMQTLGNLFETLVMRDLNAFLATYPGLGNRLGYYRDDKGLEVDAVVEVDGRWAGIEVKLSDAKVEEAARSLLKLKEKVCSNPAARNAEPAFLAVVVGRGDIAYRRPDGVYVVPAATLTV